MMLVRVSFSQFFLLQLSQMLDSIIALSLLAQISVVEQLQNL